MIQNGTIAHRQGVDKRMVGIDGGVVQQTYRFHIQLVVEPYNTSIHAHRDCCGLLGEDSQGYLFRIILVLNHRFGMHCRTVKGHKALVIHTIAYLEIVIHNLFGRFQYHFAFLG